MQTPASAPRREPVDLEPLKQRLDSPVFGEFTPGDVEQLIAEVEYLRIRGAQHAATAAFFRTIANEFARELDAEKVRVVTRAAARQPQRA